MTRDDILDELRRAMVELLELDGEDVAPETSLKDDLDLDSIDAIDLIAKMEELTGRKIDQDALKQIRTVGDIVELVHARLGSP